MRWAEVLSDEASHGRRRRSRHLALVGPTACAKSALALDLARRLPGAPVELVSVDSMQVYRGMDIGTVKPSRKERAQVPHHLIDLVEPSEDFSVARFRAAADAALADIEARGHRALLVGGTGLYVQAVVDGLTLPGQWGDVRARLENEPDTTILWRRLLEVDPIAAGRIVPNNRRRIVRALEVSLGSGHPFSSFGPGLDAYPPTHFRLAGVWLPRPVVARRIAERFRAMLSAGLLGEVEVLSCQPMSATARQALGYKELLAHLAGEGTLEEAVAEAVRRTRALARRQRVWFRRDPRIVWYGAPENPLDVLPALLADWSECKCG